VNYDGSRTGIGGYLAVEVLDADGRVVEGYSKRDCDPLGGDSIDQIVTWGERKELPTLVLYGPSTSWVSGLKGSPALPRAL